ncbi:MAG TPA: RICIN domain-containing protein [Verrucomicrobiae bacterium]|nr:RICIN domain-containing protein [Verrucomicrobiae bacterium]
MKYPIKFKMAVTTLVLCVSAISAFAGQGTGRMLYTVPNNTFVENISGDNLVTVNDSSGSISTLQTLINNARAANPDYILVIHLLSGATYWVNNSNRGLVLGSQECLVGSGALIEATNSAVTNSLITISAGSTNVSIAGGTLDGNGANIYCIYAPSSSARINIDKVTAGNCGQDCIQINGQGGGTFNNEMTVTRCDVSGSPNHSGISIWNATQTTCVDNNCHSNSVGIWLGNCAYCNIANNTCESNSVGIDFSSGNNDYIANNTCDNNGTGILLSGSSAMAVSDSIGNNSIAGIDSAGNGNIYVDDLFTDGNGTNFMNSGSGDDIVPYEGALNGSGQNYFYPPLINNQHTNTIVNGMGRYDLIDNSTTTIDAIQSEYNAAVSANPGDVVVLHLNGNYTVGANPLNLGSYTCVLLSGEIQINSSTTAKSAIASTNQSYFSISGGVIDGGTANPPSTGRNGIRITGDSMFQIDSVTLQNFGNNTERVGGSDVVQIDHGGTPRIITRCTIDGGSARGIWLATSGPEDIVSDNTVTDVQMDGVDCDESTSGSLVKFNYLHNNGRYGVFLEQSASDNLVLGNVCNYDSSFDIGCYNNSSTPRGATEYNSIICNSLLGDNGLRNGSTGDSNNVTSSYNFYFDNTVMNANIQSQLYGAQNYYSQNYMGNSSISTSGSESFFNSPDVSGYLNIQDYNSGLYAVVTNAATTNGAPIILGETNSLGSDQWSLAPTDSGYYRLMNRNSGLAMVVLGASTNDGAPIIQWTYNASGNDEWMPVSAGNGHCSFVNRLSGLDLDVPNATTSAGAQLDQQPSSGGANQQFNLIDVLPFVTVSTPSNTVSWTSGGAPDGNWENPENWGGIPPTAGDWLAFGTGLQVETTNDLSTGTVFNNIAFDSTAPSFSLNGNGLVLGGVSQSPNGTFSGGTITVNSINSQTVSLLVTLSTGAHVIETAGGAGQLSLGNLPRNAGGLCQFDLSGGAINTSLGNVNGIIGSWAVVSTAASLVNNNGGAGSVNWATVNGGVVAALSSYTSISGNGASIPVETGNNVDITGDGTNADTLSASGINDMNTLYFSASADNLQLNITSGQTLRLGSEGGILANSPRYATIGSGSSGILTAGGGNNAPGELSLYNCSYYSGGGLVINATIADNGTGYPVTVNTLGSINLNYPNSYSGGTFVNQGELYLQSGANLGYGPVYVLAGGRADFGGNNGATVTNSFYIQGYGFGPGVYNEPGAIKGTYNGTFSGLITLLGNSQIDPNAGTWPSTCTFSGGFDGAASLTIGGPSNVVAGVATISGNCSYSGDTILDASANANGGSGIFIAVGKNNIMNNGGNLVLIGGSSSGKATLDLNGTTQTINGLFATNGTTANAWITNSSSASAVLTIGNNNANGVFAGRIVNGQGTLALAKTGAGSEILTGYNTYTGSTSVNDGTLALSGSGSISSSAVIAIGADATLDASALAGQTFTLNSGQILEGNGTVNVNLQVNPGAKVMPGSVSNLGTLSVGGTVQLQGTTITKLNSGSGDQIDAGSFTFGGALIITNIGGTLTSGQTFQLFLGDTYSGAFSTITLPPLNAGLAWSNSLASNGTVQVVVTAKPQIGTVALSGTNLILKGNQGIANAQYQVLASTNLALPLNQWVPILTNNFDSNGDFNVTNTINPNVPQNFYLIQIP